MSDATTILHQGNPFVFKGEQGKAIAAVIAKQDAKLAQHKQAIRELVAALERHIACIEVIYNSNPNHIDTPRALQQLEADKSALATAKALVD